MIITEKKILKNQHFKDIIKNASFIWLLQCQQFQTKNLQELKNKIKIELCNEKIEDSKIIFELIHNKGIIKSIQEIIPCNEQTNFSFSFQGPMLLCIFLINHKTSEDLLLKGFKLNEILNKILLTFSLKTLDSTEKNSIKKLGLFLQGLFSSKIISDLVPVGTLCKKENFILPLNIWDYQILNAYQGQIKNGASILLSLLKTKLNFS